MNEAPYKLEVECHFHVGDIITTLQKASLQPCGNEILIYSTVGGSIGGLLPLTYKEDSDFFQHLEMHMRQEAPSLLGRDHMSYRSYYFPCRNVIDGDLCEMYSTLSGVYKNLDGNKKELADEIAEELDRTQEQIHNKLEEIKNNFI